MNLTDRSFDWVAAGLMRALEPRIKLAISRATDEQIAKLNMALNAATAELIAAGRSGIRATIAAETDAMIARIKAAMKPDLRKLF